ncbi:MAG: hypothetical protein ACTII7_07635 [Galactobacter sp.]
MMGLFKRGKKQDAPTEPNHDRPILGQAVWSGLVKAASAAKGKREEKRELDRRTKAVEARREAQKAARQRARAKVKASKQNPLVEIQYVEFDEDPRPGRSGYMYIWRLQEPPQVGARVKVPAMGKQYSGVVAAVGVSPQPGWTRDELSEVSRLATPRELEVAQAKRDRRTANEQAWLTMARRVVGLPTPGRGRTTVPSGFDPIPPFDGDADAQTADGYCRGWWKLYKTAKRTGRPEEEIKAFKSRAYRWAAVRDRSVKLDAAVGAAGEENQDPEDKK